jgi:hypothetical protein
MSRALLAHCKEQGATQAALGILRACYVSWLLPGLEWNLCRRHARNVPSAACIASPEDEQVMLETCRGR